MTPNEVIERIKSKKGHYTRAEWTRPVEVKKKGTPEWAQNITKRCEAKDGANARAGVNYDNLASVIAKRASGELPAENAGLPEWQEWEEFPYVLRHKTKGTRYLRLSLTGKPMTVTYLVEGKEVSYDEIEPYLMASEKRSDKPMPDVISVTLDYVTDLV